MPRRDCEFYRPLISASLDGDLDVAEQRELEQHLAVCPSCQRTVEEYRSIRSELHTLPPVPAPPPDLARSIRRETIEKPLPPRPLRWLGWMSPRWGLSTAAAIAVLLIASTLLLVRNYDANLAPSIAGSAPSSEQIWPVYQPVRIEFNKSMDHESVESNLTIFPPGERNRLPISWEDNTLVIGKDASQSVLLQPDTSYKFIVSANAMDSYGNSLGENWTLSFRTGPTSTTAQAPTEVPSVPAETPTIQPSPEVPAVDPSPAPTQATSGPAVTTAPTATSPTSVVQPTATRAAGNPTPTGNQTTSQSPTPTPPPAPSPTPAATDTPEVAVVEPTRTPQPPSTPEPAPTVVPTATPQPSPTVEPTATQPVKTPTPTPTIIPVSGAFGSVYWSNSDVQSKLGAPKAAEYVVNAAELGFQHGTMYERFDIGKIYLLYAGGTWSSASDTWTSAESAGGGIAPEGKLFVPKRGFGKIWNYDPTVSQGLGFALKPDEQFLEGRVQDFANGLMLYSDQGFVYVLYADGSWKLYPDTSGKGNLIDPTPEPGSTSTPAPDTSATPTPSAGAAQTPVPTPSSTPLPTPAAPDPTQTP